MSISKFLIAFLLICQFAWAGDSIDYNDANCQCALLMDIDENPLTDSSGNGITGALTAAGHPDFADTTPCAAFSTGYYDFDGTDDTITTTFDVDTSAATEGTILVWVDADAVTAGRRISSSAAAGTSFDLLFWDSSFNFYATPGAGCDIIGTTDPVTGGGNWYHASYIWDENGGTPSNADAELFVDGSSEGTDADLTVPTTDPLTLGTKPDASEDYNGRLDEFAIFDRALDSTEINDIMDNGLAPTVVADASQVIMIYD